MENQIQVFSNEQFGETRCYIDVSGTAWINVTDAACGLGFIQTQNKGGKLYTSIRWVTIREYLRGFGFPQEVGENDYIPENMFYRLAMKAKNETAEKFKAWIADVVIPSIRKTGTYTLPGATVPSTLEDAIRREISLLIETDENRKHAEEAIASLLLKTRAMIVKAGQEKISDEQKAATTDLPGEIWGWIHGYEGIYQISSHFRLRSFWNSDVRVLKLDRDRRGYYHVSLYKDGKGKRYIFSRLVAQTFLANPDNKPQVDHRDGDRSNNNLDNFRWVTAKENKQYSMEAGTSPRGENHKNAKLTNEQVIYIREHYKPRDKEFGRVALARKFGVSPQTIHRVVIGEVWQHLLPNPA